MTKSELQRLKTIEIELAYLRKSIEELIKTIRRTSFGEKFFRAGF